MTKTTEMINMNNKKGMIVALKESIKKVETFDSTDRVDVLIIQYRTQEKRYIVDVHVDKQGGGKR